MISHKQYVAGWFDSSIGDFLDAFPRTFDSMKYALITCLDSGRDTAALLEGSPVLPSVLGEVRPLGDGLLLPTRLLLQKELADQIFFGFDEVWFFPEEISQPKPPGVFLVGPAQVNQSRLDEMADWMAANSCSLGLGDGCGLNIVMKAQGLAKHVIGHSLQQAPSETLVH